MSQSNRPIDFLNPSVNSNGSISNSNFLSIHEMIPNSSHSSGNILSSHPSMQNSLSQNNTLFPNHENSDVSTNPQSLINFVNNNNLLRTAYVTYNFDQIVFRIFSASSYPSNNKTFKVRFVIQIQNFSELNNFRGEKIIAKIFIGRGNPNGERIILENFSVNALSLSQQEIIVENENMLWQEDRFDVVIEFKNPEGQERKLEFSIQKIGDNIILDN